MPYWIIQQERDSAFYWSVNEKWEAKEHAWHYSTPEWAETVCEEDLDPKGQYIIHKIGGINP